MKRFIGSSFDVYFHLWNNGVSHWEREKRLWEEEHEKEWSTVLSKKQKRQLISSPQKTPKKVRFAKKLVQDSPITKHKPVMHSIKIGVFEVPLSSASEQPISLVPVPNVFGRIRSDLRVTCSSVLFKEDLTSTADSAAIVEGVSNFKNQQEEAD